MPISLIGRADEELNECVICMGGYGSQSRSAGALVVCLLPQNGGPQCPPTAHLCRPQCSFSEAHRRHPSATLPPLIFEPQFSHIQPKSNEPMGSSRRLEPCCSQGYFNQPITFSAQPRCGRPAGARRRPTPGSAQWSCLVVPAHRGMDDALPRAEGRGVLLLARRADWRLFNRLRLNNGG